MARPKKTSPKGQQEGSSGTKRPAVVWIAPNLERITKGEQGRRGLADPTSGYYLSLADLVLKEGQAAKAPVSPLLSGDEALFTRPFSAESESERRGRPEPERRESPRRSSKQLKPPHVSKRPKVEIPHQNAPEHPKLALPRLQPPKPPKFDPPKLPKSPKKPTPPHGRG